MLGVSVKLLILSSDWLASMTYCGVLELLCIMTGLQQQERFYFWI